MRNFAEEDPHLMQKHKKSQYIAKLATGRQPPCTVWKTIEEIELEFSSKIHYLSHFGQTKKSETMCYKLSKCIFIFLSPWI